MNAEANGNVGAPRQAFQLPMSATILWSRQNPSKVVARCLDFNLVAVGRTDAEATRKIKSAIQAYVEYGIQRGWADRILRPAPAEFWDRVLESKISGTVDTVHVRDRRIVISTYDESGTPVEETV